MTIKDFGLLSVNDCFCYAEEPIMQGLGVLPCWFEKWKSECYVCSHWFSLLFPFLPACLSLPSHSPPPLRIMVSKCCIYLPHRMLLQVHTPLLSWQNISYFATLRLQPYEAVFRTLLNLNFQMLLFFPGFDSHLFQNDLQNLNPSMVWQSRSWRVSQSVGSSALARTAPGTRSGERVFTALSPVRPPGSLCAGGGEWHSQFFQRGRPQETAHFQKKRLRCNTTPSLGCCAGKRSPGKRPRSQVLRLWRPPATLASHLSASCCVGTPSSPSHDLPDPATAWLILPPSRL